MTAPDTAAPVSREVRRQAVLDAAKAYAATGNRLVPVIAAALLQFGIDIERDPEHMRAFATLVDGIKYAVPTPSALETLGIGEAPYCNTWPYPNSDLDLVLPEDNAAVHRARGCCNG